MQTSSMYKETNDNYHKSKKRQERSESPEFFSAPNSLMESSLSLRNTLSFHKKFHLKIWTPEDPETPIKVKINDSDLREGFLTFETIQEILKKENPFSDVDNCKIKYLNEETNSYFVLKKGAALLPQNFSSRGYVEIKLEKDTQELVRFHSEELRGSNSSLKKNKIEILEKELDELKMSVAKMRVMISAIVKNCGPLTNEFLKIVKYVYDPEEYEKLQIFDHDNEFNEPILKREKSLLPELNMIQEMSENNLDTKQSSFKTFNSPQKKNSLDFGILYSYPLVLKSISKSKQEHIVALKSDPVDFAGECKDILKSLNQEKKSLKCHIECATLDKLTKIIEEKPRVLHVCCHGQFDPRSKQYYLEFENYRAELLKLTPNSLREMLKGDDLSNIKIAFVNACHSEAVARVFFEFGIKCIIVVSSRHKINDMFAKTFSNLFYNELLREKTIKESFERAIAQLKAAYLAHPNSCCCGHAHKPDCDWYKEMKKKGVESAHCSHVPQCDCPRADYHIHDIDCEWANEFFIKYNAQWEDVGDEMRVCCCSPEITHDEIMKLKLIYKDNDPRHGNTIVFKNLKNGSVKQINPHFFAGTQFKDCNLMGMKRQIYNMFNAMVNEGIRVIYLKGKRESGKTMMSKFFANYCEERHKIDDVKYINMENTSLLQVFVAKIHNYFDTTSNKNSFTHGEGTLVILDNMDTLLRNELSKFDKKLTEVLGQSNLRFVITIEEDISLKEKMLKAYERVMYVPRLNKEVAAKMLIKLQKDKLTFENWNPLNLSQHEIFENFEMTPRKVSNIAFLLSKGKHLDQIYKIMKNEKKNNLDSKGREAENEKREFLSELKEDEEQTYNLLSIISIFSHGVLINDILKMGEILGVSKNAWIQFIIRLSLSNNIDEFSCLEIDNNLTSKIDSNCPMYVTLTYFLDHYTLNNTWIELKRERMGKREEVRIKVDHQLRIILNSHFKDNVHIFWTWIHPLTYLNYFYTSVIKKNLNENVYVEDILENTNVNSSSLWSAELNTSQKNYCYFIKEEISFSEVEDLVRFHDVNLKSFLSEEKNPFSFKKGLEAITKIENEVELTYLIMLENLMMKVLTVCKIYMRYEEGLEYIEYIRKLCYSEVVKDNFGKLKIMIELYRGDVLYKMMSRPGRHALTEEESLYEQLIVIDDLFAEKIPLNMEEWNIFRSEYLLTKFFIQNSLFRKSKDIKKKEDLMMTVGKMIHLRNELYTKGLEQNKIFSFVWAKLNYVIALYKRNHDDLETRDFKLLSDSLLIFEEFGSLKLLCKTLYLLGRLHAKKAEECLRFCKEALRIAERIGEKKLIKDLKKLVNQSNKMLRYKYQNKFMFLSSNPMNSNHYQVKHCGLNLRKNLKEYLRKTLKSSNKSILVHFDILSKKIMYELFTKNQGCKLLVIENTYDSKKGIVGESEDFKEEIFSFETLRKMSKDDPNVKINIDVLILLSDNPVKLAKFSREKGIPVVIYFKFKDKPKSFTEIITTYLQNEIKYLFLKNFIRFCLRNFDIEDAFNNAKSETVETLSDIISREFDYIEVDMDYLNEENVGRKGKRNLKFPDIEKMVEESLTIEKDPEVNIKFELEEGELEDTSVIESANMNLFTFKEPYIMRHKEIVDLYSKVKKFNWVNLHSEKGLGKSHFLKQFRNSLLIRNCYPDGVFIFHLKEVDRYSSNRNLKDLIKVEFGQRFDQNMDTFFSGKKMLIILDDFGLVCHHKEIRYPIYLMRALERQKITTLFITHKEMKTTDIIQNLDHYKLRGFDWKKSLVMFLSLQKKSFFKFKNFDENYFKEHTCFRKSHGSPKLIRDLKMNFLTKCLKIETSLLGTTDLETLQDILDEKRASESNIEDTATHIYSRTADPENEASILRFNEHQSFFNQSVAESIDTRRIDHDHDQSIGPNSSIIFEKAIPEEEIFSYKKPPLHTQILGNITKLPFLKQIDTLGTSDNNRDMSNIEGSREEYVSNVLKDENEAGLNLSETRTVNSYYQNMNSMQNLSGFGGRLGTPDDIGKSSFMELSKTVKSGRIYDDVGSHEERYSDGDRQSEDNMEHIKVDKRKKRGSRNKRHKKSRKKRKKILEKHKKKLMDYKQKKKKGKNN